MLQSFLLQFFFKANKMIEIKSVSMLKALPNVTGHSPEQSHPAGMSCPDLGTPERFELFLGCSLSLVTNLRAEPTQESRGLQESQPFCHPRAVLQLDLPQEILWYLCFPLSLSLKSGHQTLPKSVEWLWCSTVRSERKIRHWNNWCCS